MRTRARKVHSEYMTKARERDERFLTEEQRNGDTRETGPFTRALASFGRVQGLVIGAFGEMSREWDTLTKFLSIQRARHMHRQSGSLLGVQQIAALHRQRLTLVLGSRAARSIARIKLEIASEFAPFEIAAKKSKFRRYHEREMQVLLEDRHQRPRFSHGLS